MSARIQNWPVRVAVIALIALGFRLFLLQFRWAIGFDEAHYVRLAAAAVAHGPEALLHPYWPPMYSIAILFVSPLAGDFELAARLVSVLAGTLTVIPAVWFAKRLFGERIALIAGIAYALFPPFAFFSTNAMAESLFALIVNFGLMTTWLAVERGGWKFPLVSGALFALGYLTKPEGAGYLAIAGGLFLIAFFVVRPRRMQAGVVSIGLLVFGFMLFAAPYLLYLRQEMGQWTLSMKFQVNQQFSALYRVKGKDPNVRHTLTSDNRVLPTDLAYHEGSFQRLTSPAGDGADTGAEEKTVSIGAGLLLKKFAENFFKVTKTEIPAFLTFAPLLLFALGLFGTPPGREQAPFALYLLSGIVFFWLIAFPLIHINQRYFYPQLPVCFAFIGNGLYVLYLWARQTFEQLDLFPGRRRVLASMVPVLFLAGFSYVPEFGKVAKRSSEDTAYWAEAVELKAAGYWLRENVDPRARLMSYNKAVDYYAGRLDIRLGASIPLDEDLDRILAYARHKNVSYLVVSERYKTRFVNLQHLLEERPLPAALTEVYASTEPAGLRTKIFRIREPETASRAGSPAN